MHVLVASLVELPYDAEQTKTLKRPCLGWSWVLLSWEQILSGNTVHLSTSHFRRTEMQMDGSDARIAADVTQYDDFCRL